MDEKRSAGYTVISDGHTNIHKYIRTDGHGSNLYATPKKSIELSLSMKEFHLRTQIESMEKFMKIQVIKNKSH